MSDARFFLSFTSSPTILFTSLFLSSTHPGTGVKRGVRGEGKNEELILNNRAPFRSFRLSLRKIRKREKCFSFIFYSFFIISFFSYIFSLSKIWRWECKKRMKRSESFVSLLTRKWWWIKGKEACFSYL